MRPRRPGRSAARSWRSSRPAGQALARVAAPSAKPRRARQKCPWAFWDNRHGAAQLAQITARRNPNLILLTLGALALRPDVGLMAVAVWTGVSLIVHLVQILQALAAPRGQVTSWLAR